MESNHSIFTEGTAMQNIKFYGNFVVLFALLLLTSISNATASTYFEHENIPNDSNAISYDDNLLVLEKNGEYLWPDIIYSQQVINAAQQNTLKDAWTAHNLSFTLKDYPKDDIHYVLPIVNRAILNFSTGNYDKAFRYFMDAKTTMNSMKQKDFTLGKEQSKIFKGEPYEQALVSTYIGFMLYQRGDYQNARAMFSQALELDRETFAGEVISEEKPQQAQGGVALEGEKGKELKEVQQPSTTYRTLSNDNRFAYYMLARTYKHLEDGQNIGISLKNSTNWANIPETVMADSCGISLNIAKQYDIQPPVENPYITPEAIDKHNLVVIVQMGFAPQKNISGFQGQEDVIAPRTYPERKAVVYVDGKYIGQAYPMFNLIHQAASMQRTSKDSAQTGKAAGKIATTILLSIISSDLAKTVNNAWSVAADTRTWGTAPNEVQIMSAEIEPGLHNVTVLFYDQAGNPLPHYEQTHYFVPVKENKETLLLVRSLKDKCNTIQDFYASRITSYDQKKNRMIFNPNDLLFEPRTISPDPNKIEELRESKLPSGKTLDLFSVDFGDEKMKDIFVKEVKEGVGQPFSSYYPNRDPNQTIGWSEKMKIQKIGVIKIIKVEDEEALCEVIEGNPDPKETYFVTSYNLPLDVIQQTSNHEVLNN